MAAQPPTSAVPQPPTLSSDDLSAETFITTHYQLLVEYLCVDDVMDDLLSRGSITLDQQEQVKDASGGRKDKARELLRLVQRHAGIAASFIKALRVTHELLWNHCSAGIVWHSTKYTM